jgi:predicted RNA polymerase sigma factor
LPPHKHRASELDRRKLSYAQKLTEFGRGLENVPRPRPSDDDDIDDDIDDDDILRLIFTACHPILSPKARIALTLRLLGGLTTEEIVRAFLSTDATIAQRIVRAKRTLANGEIAYEIPRGPNRERRLASVLEVIYLIFNEGYSATAGQDLLCPALCEDTLHLVRVLAALMPTESEIYGLASLLEFQASRIAARTGPDGEPVLLAHQDRSKWSRLLIFRGIDALEKAGDGPYSMQAAIAACHARAPRYDEPDWNTIALLYQRLLVLSPSPIIELNRAVAISMANGPAAGLVLVDALVGSGVLKEYHLLPSVRGDLLVRLGRVEEAQAEFTKAASLTRNEQERALLMARSETAQLFPSRQ